MPELLVVLTILASLATVVASQLNGRAGTAKETITRATLGNLRTAIVDNYRADQFETLPYPVDATRNQHPQLTYLYVNPLTFVTGGVPGTIVWTYDPITHRGWSGPYVNNPCQYAVNVTRGFTANYGETGDPTPLDGWGNPIVLQQPLVIGSIASPTSLQYARLVSAGPNGVLDTPPTTFLPTDLEMNDDLVLSLQAF